MIIFLFFIKKSRMSEVFNKQPNEEFNNQHNKPYITPKITTVEIETEI
jgi:hypothetical protein